jgi:hypothetical protein
VEKRDKRFADDEEVETEVRKWLRQHSKDFCAAGFDALVICREVNVFAGFEYQTCYVLYPFRTYLRTLLRFTQIGVRWGTRYSA